MVRCMLVGMVFALGAPAIAWAQDAPESPRVEAPETVDGATIIRGRVLKPEVTVLVRRRSLEADVDLGLDRTFLDRVVDSLEEPDLAE